MMAYLRKRGKLLRFRTKLLIVLLCLSLGPILLMRTAGTGAMKRMLSKFIPQAREYLVAKHENHLQTVVEHYSFSNMLGGEILELVIYLQAQVVERALAGNPVGQNDPLFVKNYGDLLTQEIVSRRLRTEYYRLNRKGEQRPLEVDTKASAYFRVPAAANPELERDQELLKAMTPALIRISNYAGAFALWQITALDNGLYSVYPKVDHIPHRYDPRKTYWYTRALKDQKMTWSLAHVDPITRRSILNLAMPVKRPDGSLAGVTTLAVPVSTVLERKELLDQVPPNTTVIMASHGECKNCPKGSDFKTKGNDEQVLMIATQKYDESRRWNWMRPQKPIMITSQHDIPFRAMLMDLRAGRSGSQRMEYQGKDSLWIYGPMGGPTFTLMITPYTEVLGPINRVEKQIVTEIADLMQMVLAIGAVVMAVVVVVAFLFSRGVTRPISQLAEASRRLGEGDFDARVEIKTFDEFQQIGRAFNELGPRLRENYQLRQALALAMEVQQRLLPQSQPEVENLDIFGKSVYCDETGGDYYDFIFDSEAGGGTFVVVGDVTGHGLPAALLMASARAFLRQRVSMPGPLSSILEDVNRQLVLDVYQTGRFMTLLACRFSADAKSMAWSRAGHDPPLIYDPESDSFQEPQDGGLPLGVLPESEFPQDSMELKKGQIVFLGTDGIWETESPDGEFFGKDRVRQVIRDMAAGSSRDLVYTLINELERFRGDGERDDDITLIAVKVTA